MDYNLDCTRQHPATFRCFSSFWVSKKRFKNKTLITSRFLSQSRLDMVLVKENSSIIQREVYVHLLPFKTRFRLLERLLDIRNTEVAEKNGEPQNIAQPQGHHRKLLPIPEAWHTHSVPSARSTTVIFPDRSSPPLLSKHTTHSSYLPSQNPASYLPNTLLHE